MNQDTRNILIGVGLTFLAIFLIIGILFSGSFLYYMGKTSNEKEIAKVEVVANTAQNTANTAIVIAYEAKNTANDAKKTSDNAMKFVKKIAEKKPEVKVVYVQSPASKKSEDVKKELNTTQEDVVQKFGTTMEEKIKNAINPLIEKVNAFEEETKNRFDAIEDSLKRKWRNSTSYNVLGPQEQKQKKAEKDIRQYK